MITIGLHSFYMVIIGISRKGQFIFKNIYMNLSCQDMECRGLDSQTAVLNWKVLKTTIVVQCCITSCIITTMEQILRTKGNKEIQIGQHGSVLTHYSSLNNYKKKNNQLTYNSFMESSCKMCCFHWYAKQNINRSRCK